MAAHCNASETKEKIIEVQVADAVKYQLGDSVVVVADTCLLYTSSLIISIVVSTVLFMVTI